MFRIFGAQGLGFQGSGFRNLRFRVGHTVVAMLHNVHALMEALYVRYLG